MSRRGILEQLSRALSEPVMGFCALAALTVGVVPELFEIAPDAARAFDAVEWFIIGIFALEYGVNLTLAERKSAYVRDPWRLLDLAIVVGAVASALPQVTDTLRASPVLRILRLVRVLLFGARASGSFARASSRASALAAPGALHVHALRPGEGTPIAETWEAFLQALRTGRGDWLHASSVDEPQLEEVAVAAGLPATTLPPWLGDGSYPRAERLGALTSVFLWLPMRASSEIHRHGVLALASASSLCTLSRDDWDFQPRVAALAGTPDLAEIGGVGQTLVGLLRFAIRSNVDVVGYLEGEVRSLEDAPVPSERGDFFERTFRLKKQLSALRADLWRLKGLLLALAEGRVRIDQIPPPHETVFQALGDEVDYVHETVDNLRESLLSIIDLHLNLASFEMNKVMRILAVASVLGLVPAVAGGLLGMNVSGNPWPLTLPQVSFGVSVGMLLCLYIFLAKGWLR